MPSLSTACRRFSAICFPATRRQQKIFVLISPKRGGKGTIARVLRGLVGVENFCGPTLASLALPFGLWALIGR